VSTGTVAGAAAADAVAGVPVLRAPIPVDRLRTLPGLVGWCRSAERIATTRAIDFVWAGNLKPAGYVARWLRARRGIPYGIMVYGLDLTRLRVQARRSPRKRLAARAILGGASAIAAISGWTAAQYRLLAGELQLGDIEHQLRVIPLGADPVRFAPAGERYPLGPGRWLLTVARLLPHKGIDTGLAALAALSPHQADVRYAIVGDGPDRPRLEALAHQLGVADRVRFLGAVSDQQLPAIYRAATLYLGLSREEGDEAEGFGLSLVESQGCGTPVLAGRSGGIADALLEGRTGWLVDPRDAAAATARLRELLASSEQLLVAGRAGSALVADWLNWARVGADLRSAMAAGQAGR
jgi:phosphatidylinositol alpha-1,6-mannosyltransferase